MHACVRPTKKAGDSQVSNSAVVGVVSGGSFINEAQNLAPPSVVVGAVDKRRVAERMPSSPLLNIEWMMKMMIRLTD